MQIPNYEHNKKRKLFIKYLTSIGFTTVNSKNYTIVINGNKLKVTMLGLTGCFLFVNDGESGEALLLKDAQMEINKLISHFRKDITILVSFNCKYCNIDTDSFVDFLDFKSNSYHNKLSVDVEIICNSCGKYNEFEHNDNHTL